MDTNSMKKLGWSQELIDSINNIKSIVDKGAIKNKTIVDSASFKIISAANTSITTSSTTPAGNTHIHVKP